MYSRNISIVYVFAISLAFIALAFNFAFPQPLAAILFVIAIVVIGVPHGALDFHIAKSLRSTPSAKWQLGFLGLYIVITMLSILVWILAPSIGLTVFLLISVYHFSTDWTKILPKSTALVLSCFILSAPALVYQSDIIDIFVELLLTLKHATIISTVMQLLAVACFGFLVLKSHYLYSRLREQRWQGFELIGLLLSAVLLPPLIHFVLYFCLLHSIKHWTEVSHKLQLSSSQLSLISAPIVFATLIGGLIAWFLLPSDGIATDILRLVFIGLFGLTVAHMILIDRWQRQVSRQEKT